MTINQRTEKNDTSVEIKDKYKFIHEKVIKSDYNNFTKFDHEKLTYNEYSRDYILSLLSEKHLKGSLFFHFNNMDDYITLWSNGHLNVRDCKHELFKFWGDSAFQNIKPSAVFRKLGKEVIKINFIPFSGNTHLSFNSYSDFIDWLNDIPNKS